MEILIQRWKKTSLDSLEVYNVVGRQTNYFGPDNLGEHEDEKILYREGSIYKYLSKYAHLQRKPAQPLRLFDLEL